MSSQNPATRPVFIVGLPRSGTTLLRVMLDSHPGLAVGPEAPWMMGSYGQLTSFKDLLDTLDNDRRGLVKNFDGIEPEHTAIALGQAIDTLLGRYAHARGKRRWVEKTPNHMGDIPTLVRMFPDALWLHILRDGRDVACSSYNERRTWGKVIWDPEGDAPNTRLNALRRWVQWEHRFEGWREEFGLDVYDFRYEDLVTNPQATITGVLEFIGEAWDDAILDYKNKPHNLPEWEAGSRDVAKRKKVSTSSTKRWQREFTTTELQIASTFAEPLLGKYGYEPSLQAAGSQESNQSSAIQPLAPSSSKKQDRTNVLRVRLIHTVFNHLADHSGSYQFLKHMPEDSVRVDVDQVEMGNREFRVADPTLAQEIKRLTKALGTKAYDPNDLVAEARTLSAWLKGEFDLLHYLDGEHSLQFLPAIAQRFAQTGKRLPVIVTLHQPADKLSALVPPPLLRYVDRVMVLAPDQKQWLLQHLPEEKVHMILHGVDTGFFHPAAEPGTDPNARFRCLTVGSWLRDYDTLDNIAALYEGDPGIEFHIVSAGQANKSHPGNVTVHHGIPDDDLAALYHTADLVVLPLHGSTVNNAILEGIASGVPVVATDLPGVRAYVPGDESLKVSPSTPEAFKQAIDTLRANPGERLRRSKLARRRAEELAWNKVAQQINALYDEVYREVTGNEGRS